ncbi:MAG: hypothetical protein ACKVHE_02005 [Planctomycetales bacterium]
MLYSNQHTFGTNAAGKVSDIELAELMGTLTRERLVAMCISTPIGFRTSRSEFTVEFTKR